MARSTTKTRPPRRRPFLFVDYAEYKPDTYRGLYLELPEAGELRFFSSSPQQDYRDAVYYLAETNLLDLVLVSSSFDHFQMDSGIDFAGSITGGVDRVRVKG